MCKSTCFLMWKLSKMYDKKHVKRRKERSESLVALHNFLTVVLDG